MVDVAAIKDSYLCNGLSESEMAELAALGELRDFAQSSLLVKAGTESTELFTIVSGTCAVVTQDQEKLAEVGPRSLVGEVSLVDARPRGADVVCVTRVTVVAFPVVALRKAMANNRNWGFIILANISRLLAERLRNANAQIDELFDKTTDPWNNVL